MDRHVNPFFFHGLESKLTNHSEILALQFLNMLRSYGTTSIFFIGYKMHVNITQLEKRGYPRHTDRRISFNGQMKLCASHGWTTTPTIT
jgi:hypothetical protein